VFVAFSCGVKAIAMEGHHLCAHLTTRNKKTRT
jgi:hypothetical protein